MKSILTKTLWVIGAVLSLCCASAQSIHIRVDAYEINTWLSDGVMIDMHLDGAMRRQGRMRLYEVQNKQGENDTLVFFEGKYRDHVLVDTAHVYNYKSLVNKMLGASVAARILEDSYSDWFPVFGKINAVIVWWGLTEDGHVYKAIQDSFTDGRKNGLSSTFYPNGRVKGEYAYQKDDYLYRDNKRNGPFREWDEKGVLRRTGFYKNASLTGALKEYSAEGVLINSHTCYGCTPDTIRTFYPSGPLKSVRCWHNGHLQGDATDYAIDGRMQTFMHFDGEGLQDSIALTFYDNGTLKERIGYRQGKRQGTVEKWYDNGQKEAQGTYVGDRLEGAYMHWYPNGKVESKGNYHEGYQDDGWLYYTVNGSISHIRYGEANEIPGPKLGLPSPVLDERFEPHDYVQELPQNKYPFSRIAPKEYGLAFLKKYPGIALKGEIDREGLVTYTILTPLKPKEHARLVTVLKSYEINRWSPFKINGVARPLTLYMTLEWQD